MSQIYKVLIKIMNVMRDVETQLNFTFLTNSFSKLELFGL